MKADELIGNIPNPTATHQYFYVKITNYTATATEASVSFEIYDLTEESKSQEMTDVPSFFRKQQPSVGKKEEKESKLWWSLKDKIEYDVDYNNFTVIFAFDGCKYNGKNLTKDIEVNPEDGTMKQPEAGKVNFRYLIDGKLYKAGKGTNSDSWFLIEAKD